jgi:hypothetical protein
MIQTLIQVHLEEREKTLIKAHHENVTIQTQMLVLLEEQGKTRIKAHNESGMIQTRTKVHLEGVKALIPTRVHQESIKMLTVISVLCGGRKTLIPVPKCASNPIQTETSALSVLINQHHAAEELRRN